MIDQSIVDIGGHHYEYAQHVLSAAQAAGHTPVLAAHREFKSTEAPWKVFPAYRLGFWKRMSKATLGERLANAYTALYHHFFVFKTRLFFSQLGFLWVVRNNAIEYLRWHPFDSAFKIGYAAALAVIFLPIRAIFRILAAIIPFRGFFRQIWDAAWTSVTGALGLLFESLSSGGTLQEWRFQRRKARLFAADTLELLRALKPEEGDLIFIPTLGVPEMIGLIEVWEKYPEALKATYHLLFRRNLYDGREWEYPNQDAHLTPLRNAYLSFRSRASAARVFFYTDTEELTIQHERVSSLPFHTCPIPHTECPSVRVATPAKPLQLVYLGDARAEKGYHFFPALVEDLRRDFIAKGRVEFQIQSNYNIPKGESEAVVARCLLQGALGGGVKLFLEPLPSEQYRAVLREADLLILPYDRDNYYARSSGVLIEALTAGIPVVAPAASWLGRQFADGVYAYRNQLLQKLEEDVVPIRRHQLWQQPATGKSWYLGASREISFGGGDRAAQAWISVPAEATYLWVRMTLEGSEEGHAVLVSTTGLDRAGRKCEEGSDILSPGYASSQIVALVPVGPDTTKVLLNLRHAFADVELTGTDFEVGFLLQQEGAAPLPLSAIGVAYTHVDKLSSAVREVLAHYDHYRNTAMDNAPAAYDFHNAGRLVSMLTSIAGAPPEAPRAGQEQRGSKIGAARVTA
ncbi:glycosyltransferase [Paludibaculum fermentans]|uniref:Glycosyltransferase n=1 Tax=Paludibaculum fermentans TaxID=1473598 RepID=A0A7S7NKP5_PALFE|nr:glycosyltransferase [Paludibaculum fermentans]QOY85412.1 glycosyltransferase [Paludibaculum fermentans]